MYFITKGRDLRKVVVLLKFLSTGAKTLIVSSRNMTDYGKAKSNHTATKVADLREGSFVSTGHKTKIQNFHSEENFQAYFEYDGHFLNKGKYLFYRIDNPKFDID